MGANKTWKNASSSGENKSLENVGVCFLQSGRIFCIMLTTFLHIGVHNTSRPLETKNYKYVYILCIYIYIHCVYCIWYIVYCKNYCISATTCICIWMWKWDSCMYTKQNTPTTHFPEVGEARFQPRPDRVRPHLHLSSTGSGQRQAQDLKQKVGHGAFRPIFMSFFPPRKNKTLGCKSGEEKCLVLQHTPMNIHEDCCTNAFWKKTVWTLLWRNQSLSFWPVFETSWQLRGLGKEIMNKRAQLEHTQCRKFLDRNSNFVAPALIPFHKAERLQKFEPNPRQKTNLPFGWMFDNLDLLDSITSSCRQNSIVCTAAHTSSRVTSKFRSVESMHITQSLIGSRSHQHPSAVLYTMENATLFLNVRTNGKYRPGCINHSSQNVAKSNYIKQCSFGKRLRRVLFGKNTVMQDWII